MTDSITAQLVALRTEVGQLRRENARLTVELEKEQRATEQARHERDMSRGKTARLEQRIAALKAKEQRGNPQRGQVHANNLPRVPSPSGQKAS
jgi:uncharacterized protein (DUF3084 family)